MTPQERDLLTRAARLLESDDFGSDWFDDRRQWLNECTAIPPSQQPTAQPQRSGLADGNCDACGAPTGYAIVPRVGDFVPCCSEACKNRILSTHNAKEKP